MATEESNTHVGKVLELKSPFGTDSMSYKWPLKKGRGSIRRSEVSIFCWKINCSLIFHIFVFTGQGGRSRRDFRNSPICKARPSGYQ